MDHEMAYIALRDADPRWVRALMADDAMTIPARLDEAGVARAAQTGPVFSVDADSGALHMRYTARTRSIEWKADAGTREAVAFLRAAAGQRRAAVLAAAAASPAWASSATTCCTSAAPSSTTRAPRLLYRARYLDRVQAAG